MMWDAVRWRGALGATLILGSILTGCGGGGGGNDDDDPPANQPDPGPAPDSLGGQLLTLETGAETRQIAFAVSGAGWTETRGGVADGGTYQYIPAQDGNTAELRLADADRETGLTLVFASQSSGAFNDSTGENGQGNFTLQPSPNPGDPGNPDDDPPGFAPTSLSGRTMLGTRTFTSTGPVGQTHVYTFSANTFHDSDPPEESDGAFFYEPNGNRAALTLAYDAPRNFNGDRHELQMTFHNEDTGIFQSTYTRRDGTVININGTFDLQ